jgi:hypothetical protein
MEGRVMRGSRFADSSDDDDEDLPPPRRGIGRDTTASLPPESPSVSKRSSFSQLFGMGRGRKSSLDMTGVGERKGSVSKRTGKPKRFQGLRKLFRIYE